MIARHWRGFARADRANDYAAHPMMIEYDHREVHYEVLVTQP